MNHINIVQAAIGDEFQLTEEGSIITIYDHEVPLFIVTFENDQIILTYPTPIILEYDQIVPLSDPKLFETIHRIKNISVNWWAVRDVLTEERAQILEARHG